MMIKKLLHTQQTQRLECELILAHIIKKPREFLIAHPELKISKIQETEYKYLLWKLKRGYPLAYLIGHREFYGLDFLINKYTLVPRPETELMVELAIEKMKRLKDCKIILLDVGTGSGCIPISIIKSFNLLIFQSFGVDISKGALKVAKKNAKKHGTAITFLHGNLLEPFIRTSNKQLEINNLKLVITSNLPYLTQTQFENEPSIQKEPYSALVAKDNGLALYKELLQQIKSLVTNYQLQVTIFMEIDPAQAELLNTHCQQLFPHGILNTHKDLLGNIRVISMDV